MIVALVLLTGATGYLTYELIQEKTARRALEASQKILEADFEAQQKELEGRLEELKEEDHYLNENMKYVRFELINLDDRLTINKSKKDEKDTRVHRTNNADSLRGMVARRYER